MWCEIHIFTHNLILMPLVYITRGIGYKYLLVSSYSSLENLNPLLYVKVYPGT